MEGGGGGGGDGVVWGVAQSAQQRETAAGV